MKLRWKLISSPLFYLNHHHVFFCKKTTRVHLRFCWTHPRVFFFICFISRILGGSFRTKLGIAIAELSAFFSFALQILHGLLALALLREKRGRKSVEYSLTLKKSKFANREWQDSQIRRVEILFIRHILKKEIFAFIESNRFAQDFP